MIRELDNFIIESDIPLDYFDEIVDYIIENERSILDFFKFDKLPKKVKISFVSYEPFKKAVIESMGSIQPFHRGLAKADSKTILLLNLDDQVKYTNHSDTSIEDFKKTVIHEIVHQCQNFCLSSYEPARVWFSEGLAANLAKQGGPYVDLIDSDFAMIEKDFNKSVVKYKYRYTYLIVKYVLENYSDEEITKLYSDVNYLKGRSFEIFKEAKDWYKEKMNTQKH